MSSANATEASREAVSQVESLSPRAYQLHVLKCAIERNTLAFLPTGEG